MISDEAAGASAGRVLAPATEDAEDEGVGVVIVDVEGEAIGGDREDAKAEVQDPGGGDREDVKAEVEDPGVVIGRPVVVGELEATSRRQASNEGAGMALMIRPEI